MELIKLAEELAREAHKGQTRWDGTPYIEHLKRVAQTFTDPDCIVVGWLHDVLEITDLSPPELIKKGIPVRLVNIIEILTRRKGQSYCHYILNLRYDDVAKKVKKADITDNLNDNLKEGSLKDKYRLARHILERVINEKENR